MVNDVIAIGDDRRLPRRYLRLLTNRYAAADDKPL